MAALPTVPSLAPQGNIMTVSETTTVDDGREELNYDSEKAKVTPIVHQVADGGTKAWLTLLGRCGQCFWWILPFVTSC